MAGLIPQNFIDELLSRVDIVDVIDKRVKLRKTGKNYSALCPFHQEKSPSFSVQPEKQFYYCFGCGAGGNALGFVMGFDNKDFPEAVESLAADCGLSVPREQSGPRSSEQDRQQSENKELYKVLAQASDYYQQQLRRHQKRDSAVSYLKSRGLTGQIAQHFAIGFAPPGWDGLLKHLGHAGVSTELMMKCGLIVERDPEGHYDRFRDRIIFPIRDQRGRVIAFGGRVLGDDKPKYLNSPETAVYHKGRELYGLYEARKSRGRLRRVIIVEGYMDVVALAQHGIDYAVATLGTATNSTHLTRLFRMVPEVVYCFDGDEAGRTAAWRGLEATLPVLQDGLKVRFLFLPEGEDPDTLVRKIGKDSFSERIEQARNLEDFFFDHLSSQVDVNSMEGKAGLATLAAPLLRQLPEGVFRQLMRKRLLELTGVDDATIDRLLAQKPARSAASSDPGAGGKAAGSRPAAPSPPAMPEDQPPPWLANPDEDRFQLPRQDRPRPRTAAGKSPRNRAASLTAIELLLLRPEVALEETRDLQILHELDDIYVGLLVKLIELVKNDPTITTYVLLGHCYGTPEGNQLTQLMKNEKITPAAGIKEEFSFLIDSMLANAEKLRYRKHLMEQLNSRLKSRSAPGAPPASGEAG